MCAARPAEPLDANATRTRSHRPQKTQPLPGPRAAAGPRVTSGERAAEPCPGRARRGPGCGTPGHGRERGQRVRTRQTRSLTGSPRGWIRRQLHRAWSHAPAQGPAFVTRPGTLQLPNGAERTAGQSHEARQVAAGASTVPRSRLERRSPAESTAGIHAESTVAPPQDRVPPSHAGRARNAPSRAPPPGEHVDRRRRAPRRRLPRAEP